jgi:hypothetical protein
MQLTIKHGASQLEVEQADDVTGLQVKQFLERQLGIFIRHQKVCANSEDAPLSA